MMKRTFAMACVAFFASCAIALAESGGFTNAGGALASGSSVTNPAGTLTISGNALTFQSTDGTTTINATFSASSTTESCSGGGKGGHVTCSFTFTGTFSGTLAVNGATQAIVGATRQLYGTNGVVIAGTTGYNSAYTPFYFSNTGQILRSDDLNGTNLVSYGTQGSGVGQFYGAYGLTVDSAGRIYVADTYNDRIVRIDDMNGTNWTTFGGYGSGAGQFADPSGISIDAAGRIYVMDTGNNRLVRMDDMTGANWTTFDGLGSGTGQFAQFVAPVAFDANGRIYVADGGNKRIVRMDDMTGANWTTLTQSPVIGMYIYSFASPIGVAVDGAGRIYVADSSAQPSVVRVDDMSGTNWTSVTLGAGATPHSITVDAGGMVLVGGGGAQIVDGMAAGLGSSSALTQFYGPYYVFGATLVPVPGARPSAVSLSPSALTFSQNVGTVSAAQTVTVSNFGGSSLTVSGISADGEFVETNDCPGQLPPGAACTVSVTFAPSSAGPATGSLTVHDDSGNAGTTQSVALDGTGTAPAASVTPSALTFSSQVLGTTSAGKNVTLKDTGTGPLQVAGVTVTGPFSETDTCAGPVAPGSSCTITVTFTPVAIGSGSGTLTIVDDAGTQTVPLTGTGMAPVTFSASTLSFGTVAVGSTSAIKTVTLTNHSSAPLALDGVIASPPFAVASSTCGATVNAGGSCAIGVTFSPTAIGSAAGTLTFTDSAPTSPQTVNLTATGSAPVTFSASSLSFGTVAIGNVSAVKNVTLTNRNSVSLGIAGIETTPGFAVASSTCGTSVPAGASCTVGVTFSPLAVGAATGTLTFTDSAVTSPQAIAVSGTGSLPVTLSATTLSFGSVTVGTASSTKSVTLTNKGNVPLSIADVSTSAGFAVVSNTCGAAVAAGGKCTIGVRFSPTAKGAVTGTLTITDSAITSPQTVTLTGTGK